MIIKLQRALFPPDGPWLAYNEDRSLQSSIDDAKVPTAVKNAMGDRPKGFFNTTLDERGRLIWGQPVKDPGW